MSRAMISTLGSLAVIAVVGLSVLGGKTVTAQHGSGTEAETSVFSEVPWKKLHFSARKFLLTATTSLAAEQVDSEQTAAELRDAPKGEMVAVATPRLTRVVSETDMPFGRFETSTAWLDPRTGAALQSEKLATGSKQYWKLRRYTDIGMFMWRSEPRNGKEEKLRQPQWSKRSEYMTPYPEAPPVELALTDSYALLYLISSARLDREGAQLELCIFSDKRLVALRFEAGNLVEHELEHDETWTGGSRRRRGTVKLREVTGAGRLLGNGEAGGNVDLGFLGMQGSLHVLLEPGTAIPVQVSGKTKNLGKLTVNLDRVELRAEPAGN